MVHPHCVIGGDVIIGDDVQIMPGAVIGLDPAPFSDRRIPPLGAKSASGTAARLGRVRSSTTTLKSVTEP
ncbi:MAG: hypothetical protein IPI67_19450 [Myxococcales bacterium]|nr:hypothetical protein [Myxococcales bacterium]